MRSNHTEEDYSSYNGKYIFRFSDNFIVNTTIMGQKISFPLDPNQSGVLYDYKNIFNTQLFKFSYNCFAPILINKTNTPNLFWATCPYQSQDCQLLLKQKTSCLSFWKQASIHEAIVQNNDIKYLIEDAIREQSNLWKLPLPTSSFVLIQWQDLENSYKKSFLIWWLTLLCGNLIIFLWIAIRRPFLKFFCGPYEQTYQQLN